MHYVCRNRLFQRFVKSRCSVRLAIDYIGFSRRVPPESKFIIQKGLTE